MTTPTISIACHSFRTDGGMGRYVQLLAEGLLNLGIHPTVITKKIDYSLPLSKEVSFHHINCKFIPSKLRDYYYDYKLGKYLQSTPLDIVISCNRNTHSDIAICGGTHLGYCQAMGKTLSFFDKKMISLERKFYTNSKLVVAHSKGMQTELIKIYGLPLEKCPTIYPPISLETFQRHSHNKQTINSFPQEQFTFVIPSAGNHKMKGLDLLIQYFEKTTLPIKLLIAGRPISGNYKNVVYIGFRKDMPDVFRSADFTILASRYEAFGQVAIESVACGTPVVLANNVCAAEVISDDVKFTFDRNSFESFENAVKQAIKLFPHSKIEDPIKHMTITTDITQHAADILNTFLARNKT